MIRNVPAVRPPEWPDYHPLFGYVDADVEVLAADGTITTIGVFLNLDPINEQDLAGVRNAVLTDVAWAADDSNRAHVVREKVVWAMASLVTGRRQESEALERWQSGPARNRQREQRRRRRPSSSPSLPRPRRLNLRFRYRPVRQFETTRGTLRTWAVEVSDRHTVLTLGCVAGGLGRWRAWRIGAPAWTGEHRTRDAAAAAMLMDEDWRTLG